MTNKLCYLDHASTSPLANIVKRNLYEAMEIYGNPANHHQVGEEAYSVLKKSKQNILKNLGHDENWDILFTSGATEAINTVFNSYSNDGIAIISNGEHKATIKSSEQYMNDTIQLEISNYLKVPELKTSYNTILLSLISVNNETGDIITSEWVANIKAQIHKQLPNVKIIVHLDHTQGFCKVPYDMKDIDCYSFSGHKLGFFKGFGGLIYRKDKVNLMPLLVGGGQQKGLRSTTENPMFVYLLDKLIQDYTENFTQYYNKGKALNLILKQLLNEIATKYKLLSTLNSINHNFYTETSPYIINFSFKGIEGESLMSALSDKICVSTGSACNSSDLESSHVLAAIYKTLNIEDAKEIANCAIRLSFDHTLDIDELIKIFTTTFNEEIKTLARISIKKDK